MQRAETPRYTHDDCVQNSEKVAWTIAEVLSDEKFDFNRRFMPESLAQVRRIACLGFEDMLVLNQLRGLSYAHLFGFVEEFIVRKIHEMTASYGPDHPGARRALLRFTEEEVKHQVLFDRTKAALLKGLGECGLISGAGDVAAAVLSKSTLGVLLLTAMLEWTTQVHYIEAFRSAEEWESLDPTFVRIFKSHWLEEAQHAKLDELEIKRVAGRVSQAERDRAVDEVLEIGGAFDGLLQAQAELDLASLERITGRTFNPVEREEILTKQDKAYRYTFLVSGLTHGRVIEVFASVCKDAPSRLAAAAKALSA